MTTLLEERYRRALRLLPSAYRDRWEDDMVATFLDSAYTADPDDPEGVGLGSPSRSELVSIAALAIRLRLGGTEAPPRSFAWGEATRIVALVGLLAHAVGALAGLALNLWIAARLPLPAIPPDAIPVAPDPWRPLWIVAPVLWVPAFLLLVYGNWRVARTLSLLALAGLVAGNVVDVAALHAPFTFARACGVAFEALPVLAMAAFHHTAPTVARGRWLWALLAGSLALVVAGISAQLLTSVAPILDWSGIWCVGLVVATVFWRGLSGVVRLHWSVALAALGLSALIVRVTSLTDYVAYAAASANRVPILAVDWVECGVFGALSTVFVAFAVRGWRRLPGESWPGASSESAD